MAKRTAILAALIGLMGVMVCVSCISATTVTPTLVTLVVPSPTDLNLTAALTATPTSLLINAPSETPAASCPWIAYRNGEVTPSLSNENCLDDLRDIGISGDAKQISFSFQRLSTLGTYGICQDISNKDELKFTVAIHDSIVSTRFLIMIGPEPIPTKESSRGFRIQPELLKRGQKDIWVKLIEYVLDDYEEDVTQIQAVPDWKKIDFWNFDFLLQFSGSEVHTSMNKKAFAQSWPLNTSTRYLCFAYQPLPTADNAAELKALVTFP